MKKNYQLGNRTTNGIVLFAIIISAIFGGNTTTAKAQDKIVKYKNFQSQTLKAESLDQPNNNVQTQLSTTQVPQLFWPSTGYVGWIWHDSRKNSNGTFRDGTHGGVDIWTSTQCDNGGNHKGNAVYPVYKGVVTKLYKDHLTSDPSKIPVQGVQIYHSDLGLYSNYFHMANRDATDANGSYVDPNLNIGSVVDPSIPIGYQGDRPFNAGNQCVHLHFSIAISPLNLDADSTDPSPYFGIQLSSNDPKNPPVKWMYDVYHSDNGGISNIQGATLFMDPNFGGQSTTLTQSDDDLCDNIITGQTSNPANACHTPGVLTWNDNISSMKISPGYGVVLLLHSRQTDIDQYGQKQARLHCNQNIPDFSQLSFEGTNISLNDNVSAIIIEKCTSGTGQSNSTLSLSPDKIATSNPFDPCDTSIPYTNDSATFVSDLTIPDGMIVSPSQGLVKTWRLKNTGSSTWGSGYQLAFVSGEQMGAPNAVNVPVTAPNATADISINLTAPTASGDHTGYWQMRNSQGTYFGQQIWVKVKTVAAGGGSGTTHITMFDISPTSPSPATSVHLVGRISTFPEFRSMRFVAGNNTFEMTNYRQVGSQYEISTDWNTASLARGNYTLTLEVATKGDTNWANPERQVKTYTLNGTPASTNRPPDRPVLLSPYNWYLKDAAGASTQVQMCVSSVNDPDGDAVQYYFEWSGANPDNSGWVSSTCVSPTLSPNGYTWHAKARDSQGAESGWSVDTWNFNVAFGNVSIGTPTFYQVTDPDNTHMCVLVTYGGINAPDVKAWINLANDGTENGEWRQLDHYGPNTTPDCTSSNVHGFWIRSANYTTGNHVIRITAVKNDSGASDSLTLTQNIPYMRPPAPQAIAPSSHENNGTWWNMRTINFQWGIPIRTDSQTLRVTTSSNVWGDPAPLLNVPLNNTVSQYTYSFTQDYAKLYWSVRATNTSGSADSGNDIWFGIDLVKPTCQVQALSATTYESVFMVTWSGLDGMAGVRSYNIQSQDSARGSWDDWMSGIPSTKTYDLFTGQPGHTYFFRCLATDNANNIGSYPSTADTHILVDPASRPPTAWWNPAYGGKRNLTILNNMPSAVLPAGYPVHLHFDSGTPITAADVYNASQSSTKCDDLRIIKNDATDVNRFVQNCSPSAVDIWFRTQVDIPAGASDNTTHQLYFGSASANNPIADAGLIWYPYRESDTTNLYLFQEGSGATAYDYSGNGRNCTINPTVNWSTAKWGSGLHFSRANNGNTISLTCGSPYPISALTAEFWWKPDVNNNNTDGRLAGQLGPSNQLSWLVSLESDHLKFERWCNGGSQQARGNINIRQLPYYGQWNYLAVTFDGGNQVKFYINGSLDNAVTLGNSCSATYNIPLEIGSVEGGGQGEYTLGAFRLSNSVKTNFPAGSFVNFNNEPTLAAGALVAPPATGSPDLTVLSLTTYPNPDGGILVEAQIQNQGTRSTQNGFYTDLYVNHVPSGAGDYNGSLRFWVNDPIAAGATVTLTTVINDLSSLSGIDAQSLAPGTESSGTLYAQTDSAGVVSEPNKSNNIFSAGTQICVATADAYESDDTTGTASTISLGQTQTHNFDQMSDQDWIKFTAQAGEKYYLSTSNLGVSADTYLYLYDTDGQTLLASNDDYNNTLASLIEWTAPQNGTYYVLVKGWNPNTAGCGTSYNFSISNIAPGLQIYLPLVNR